MNTRNSRMLGASLVAACLLTALPAFAAGDDDYVASLSQAKIQTIEVNIVNALTSGIPGMQADASQVIRDMKALRPEQRFSACVVPLMAIVKDEQTDAATRVLAAFALDQLESAKGDFAITRTALFTDSPSVKHVCTWLAYERKTGRTADSKGIAVIEPLEEIEY